jgi:hypothetical protein
VARRLRDRVLADARASTHITFQDADKNVIRMTWGEYALSVASQGKTGTVNYWLINQPTPLLWTAVYALAGLAGGCIYLLLLVAEPAAVGQGRDAAKEFVGARFFARLSVSTAAGALAFLVAILPAKLAIMAIKLPKVAGVNDSDAYASLLLLPTASGIFVSTFFNRVQEWLGTTLSSKKPKDGDSGAKTPRVDSTEGEHP